MDKDKDLNVNVSTQPLVLPIHVPTLVGNGGNLVEIAKKFHKAANFVGNPNNPGGK